MASKVFMKRGLVGHVPGAVGCPVAGAGAPPPPSPPLPVPDMMVIVKVEEGELEVTDGFIEGKDGNPCSGSDRSPSKVVDMFWGALGCHLIWCLHLHICLVGVL